MKAYILTADARKWTHISAPGDLPVALLSRLERPERIFEVWLLSYRIRPFPARLFAGLAKLT